MNIVFIIVGILFCILALMISFSEMKFLDVIAAWIGAVLIVAGINYYRDRKPTALDVYRGNTTLEITYREGIPIDSVVVFKDLKQ